MFLPPSDIAPSVTMYSFVYGHEKCSHTTWYTVRVNFQAVLVVGEEKVMPVEPAVQQLHRAILCVWMSAGLPLLLTSDSLQNFPTHTGLCKQQILLVRGWCCLCGWETLSSPFTCCHMNPCSVALMEAFEYNSNTCRSLMQKARRLRTCFVTRSEAFEKSARVLKLMFGVSNVAASCTTVGDGRKGLCL